MQDYFGPDSRYSKKTFIKSYGVMILLIIVFIAGYFFGKNQNGKNYLSAEDLDVQNQGLVAANYALSAPDFQMFWDVWQEIKTEYVKQPVNETELFYGAMRGLLSAVDDPYSEYYDPEMAARFNEELSGSFSGIGVEIALKNDLLVVVTPLEGSPGFYAGLRPGDIIVSIEDQETFDMPLDVAVSLIRGEEGTPVTLGVVSGDQELKTVVITRQTIEHTGMRWEVLDGGIAHLKLSSFDEESEELLNQFIREEVETGNVKSIILDMRNNPGGFLDMAIEVASEWIEQGIVLRERDNSGEERQHHARGRARLSSIPTVVLVNEGSASASEIVAGALQDYGLARLIGMTTFGKGSVQKYESLDDGSAFRLTVAEWFTPFERAINEVGVAPDIEIDLTEEDFDADRDPQLDKALELLK